VGYEPLIPGSLPPGYQLKDVATSPQQARDWAGREGLDPSTQDPHESVHLRYRRDCDSFSLDLFSLRPSRAPGGIDAGEVAGYLEGVDQLIAYRAVELEGGPFAGKKAATWFDANGANLLVYDDDYLVLISGALTRQELIDVAQSLEPQQP